MHILQKKVIQVDSYLSEFQEGEEICLILNNPTTHIDKLEKIGFNPSLIIGSSILPKAIGSISSFNANGKFELLRKEPKETYNVEREFEWLAYGKHQMSKSVIFTYNRFKRKLIDAPNLELIITKDNDNNKIVSSRLIKFTNENKMLIKHQINLFLELFGECQLVDKNLLSRIKTPIKRLNWNLLPKGKMPWVKLEEHLNKKTDISSTQNYKEIYARINYINSFEPDFYATGNGGFNDYVVLGFENKNIFVLENRKPQNATYIFKNNWTDVTKLTKAEILRENLQDNRLIHNLNWKKDIKEILE